MDDEDMGDIASTLVRQGRAMCNKDANIFRSTTGENTKLPQDCPSVLAR